MQNTHLETTVSAESAFEFDTSFVLFFLAMEIGHKGLFTFEGILMAPALAAVLIGPYLLVRGGDTSFGHWAAGRGVISGLGLALGAAFAMAVGTLLPESFEVLPFTLLIMACMATAFLSFGALLGFKLER
ncbi:MAG: hypothetical protein IPM63_03855 [Acidobacteriota bacterium]|nr:MAG: hypothetical protein IPM63_03855 [Acidobacteriota bacterium]